MLHVLYNCWGSYCEPQSQSCESEAALPSHSTAKENGSRPMIEHPRMQNRNQNKKSRAAAGVQQKGTLTISDQRMQWKNKHHFSEGSTVPLHSPKPSRKPSSFSHTPFKLILSPSCKNLRVTSPPFSLISFSPAHINSSKEPKLVSSGPEKVPLPSKSPGRMLHPLTVWWASCCANE